MSTKSLVLAMAPIEEVISSLKETRSGAGKSVDGNESGRLSEQELFSENIHFCWTDKGPSNRYMKTLIQTYVARLERAGITIESDTLMDLVFRASLSKNIAPHPEESCYLSFQLPREGRIPLIIQVYPYHNDVSLRLWEAGATLAEYFLEHPETVKGKRVIELGAGVGLTGLVLAGCCGTTDMFLTDYTEQCRVNMDHNIRNNLEWLKQGMSPVARPRQGHLEWCSFGKKQLEEAKESALSATQEISIQALNEADLLIAADVAYDVSELGYLVDVVHQFLRGTKKAAIFAMTRRNMSTFETFVGLLKKVGIVFHWVSSGPDYDALPRCFPCRFNQERADVRIASLAMAKGSSPIVAHPIIKWPSQTV